MDHIKFENFLGSPESLFREAIGNNFDNTLFKKDFYYNIDENIRMDFYGVPYKFLSISTDEKKNVQSITVHLQEAFAQNFYDKFIEHYGKPSSILVIENRQLVSNDTIESDDFNQEVSKSTFALREGTFDENPLFMIWSKEKYQIKAFLRYKQNISEITFSIRN